MHHHSLADWLAWQETLNPAEIELGLERIRKVAGQLALEPPSGAVFVVTGTNGKGSCASFIDAMLRSGGVRTGLYTSPHLIKYNERIRIAGAPVDDEALVKAFEAIEAVRCETPLTFFEYGTLAALKLFTERECDAWVLEVGLGGRLDAVNIVDADFSVITTVDIDHCEWLGNDLESIAFEKAGIMREAHPAFFGDRQVPAAIVAAADQLNSDLSLLGRDFAYVRHADSWSWRSASVTLDTLPLPHGAGEEQLRNISTALAVINAFDPHLIADKSAVVDAIRLHGLPGRFQIHTDEYEWILDVAHNRQSAAALLAKLEQLPQAEGVSTIVVIGMLADKQAEEFVSQLAVLADRWITCDTAGARGSSARQLAERIEPVVDAPVLAVGSVADSLEQARRFASPGDRILICGSFTVVGPALEQLGLYSPC